MALDHWHAWHGTEVPLWGIEPLGAKAGALEAPPYPVGLQQQLRRAGIEPT